MVKLPAMMLYPNDWEGDEIAYCSLAAQGLWLRMMFFMHRSTRYGYLALPNGSAIPPLVVAARCGITEEAYLTLLSELDSVGKLGRTSEGVIFSRRMVRDEQKRSGDRKRKEKERSAKRDVTPHVTHSVTALSGGITSSISIAKKKPTQEIVPDLEPSMVSQAVMTGLRLSSRDTRVVLDDLCRMEMEAGKDPDELKDQLIASWKQLEKAKAQQQLEYSWGSAKFFGDGHWKNSDAWPWKPNEAPQIKRKVYL